MSKTTVIRPSPAVAKLPPTDPPKKEISVVIYGPPASGKTTLQRHLEFWDGSVLSDVDRRREYRKLIQATAISSLTELVEFALSLGWSLAESNLQRYGSLRSVTTQFWREQIFFPLKLAYDMKCLWDDEMVQAAYREPSNPNRNKLVTRYYLEKLFLLFENQYVPNKLDILSTHDQAGHDEDAGQVELRHDDTRIKVVTATWDSWLQRRLPECVRKPYVVVLVAPIDDYDRDPMRVVPRPVEQPKRKVYGNPLETLTVARRQSRGAMTAAVPIPQLAKGDAKSREGLNPLTSSQPSESALMDGECDAPPTPSSSGERSAREDEGAISDGGLSPKLPSTKQRSGKSSSTRHGRVRCDDSDQALSPGSPGIRRHHSHRHEVKLPCVGAQSGGSPGPMRLVLRPRGASDHLERKSPHSGCEKPQPLITKVESPRGPSPATTSVVIPTAAATTTTTTSDTDKVGDVAAATATAAAPPAVDQPYDNHLTRLLAELGDVADHKLLQEAAEVVVYLNRLDVYWQKSRTTSVKCSFPEYTGGADPRRALEHIVAQFEAKLKAKKRPFRHQVVSACSLDDEQMTSVVIPLLADEMKRCAKEITEVLPPIAHAPSVSAAAAAAVPDPSRRRKGSSAGPVESKKLKLKSGAVSEIGRRASNEDTHVIAEDVTDGYSGKEKLNCFAVYDGHGGCNTAAAASQLVLRYILEDAQFAAGDVEQATRNAYLRADTAMAEVSGKDRSGSTAVTAMILGKTLYVANIGDSECVIGHKEGKELQHTLLTYKHLPTMPDEKQRVTSIGGMVVSNRLFGTLAVSRAFGDREFKDASRMFVIADPHIVVRPLTRADQVLVVACDGLWDKVTYQEAVEFVMVQRAASKTPEESAKLLAQLSLDRGSMDNVTVIVVYFTWY